MEVKTATIIGATGLVGSNLLNLLRADGYYSEIRVIVRRPVDFKDPRLILKIIDFSDSESFRKAIEGSDSVFCAVGTTQKKVGGDKDAYRKVDYHIPANAAKYCAETGCHNFLLVSSVGANSRSSNFYLKLKGEVEDAIRGLNIRSVSVFRPSMLLGKREEFRFGEIIGKIFFVPLSFLAPSRYKPVYAKNVAAAMIAASKTDKQGFHIYHYKEIKNLAGSWTA